MIVDVILFVVFIAIICGIAWWSIRQNEKQLAEHNEKIKAMYQEHSKKMKAIGNGDYRV